MNNPRIAHTFKIRYKMSMSFPFKTKKREWGGNPTPAGCDKKKAGQASKTALDLLFRAFG